jgi:hypothetical protein
MTAPVLITGATGFIGRRLCSRLLEQGREVRVLSRHPDRAEKRLPGIARAYPWQPLEGPPPHEALEGVETVIHLAGEAVAGRWTATKKRLIRETRVQGTRHLVEALPTLSDSPSVLISASAVGYYGEGGEKELTEESPPGDDFLAQTCQQWEAEAARATEYGVRVVQVRIGLVLHPEGGVLARMLPPFRMGLGGPIGDGQFWMPWIHREDLVSLFLFAEGTAALEGPVNGVAPHPVRNEEFAAMLGRVLGRPAFLPTPLFLLRLSFGEFARYLATSQRVYPQKALDAGFEFRFPTLEEALQDLLD